MSMQQSKHMRRNAVVIGIIFVIIILTYLSCSKSPNHKNVSVETIKIEAKPSVVTLYYSDFISPIQTTAVRNTEADGIVSEKYFEFGKNVEKGKLLFVILSPQLSKNYYEAIRQYVKSVETLATAQYQMLGAEYLKKLQIMSEQEYSTTKTQLFNAKLDFADSTSRLIIILQNEGMDVSILEKIHSKNPQVIYDTLSKMPKTNIYEVYAPQSGIALLPVEEGKDSSKGPVLVGAQVKSGQQLLVIGDMSGISVTVKLSETYIDKIKEGQKAIVTSDAFPGIALEGKVVTVGRQAVSSESGSKVPSFAVTVTVPAITKAALNKIRVGMSADVAFPLVIPPMIRVPFTAVYKKNGRDFVNKIDPNSQKIIATAVETGGTEINSVEIIKGLKDKDEVVVNASSN